MGIQTALFRFRHLAIDFEFFSQYHCNFAEYLFELDDVILVLLKRGLLLILISFIWHIDIYRVYILW